MALAPGTQLGPYEITAPLGAGGMGEVYRARDTRLERTVAVKVLPSHFSASPDLKQRFQREARAISSLQHPHICALFDVGSQDGIDFLVMEYLEGETLADRLEKSPLPLADLLLYATEMADALWKAHRQGVVHRDLKPSNIMLTKAGTKMLDFGLAKAPEPLRGGDWADAPTLSRTLTVQGTIIGTMQYMSPEQLEGKEADARSDIFSFGAVLYEMTTGKKAFAGKSQVALISAIMTGEPAPMSQLQPLTPPALERIVKTCLAKDPDDRFQTAHDLKVQLDWLREAGSQAGMPAHVAAGHKNREKIWITLAGFLLASCAALTAAYFARSSVSPRVMRTSVLPPEKASFRFTGPGAGAVTISPDATNLAFAAVGPDGKQLLFVRPLEALSARPLAGTDGASNPFWSPDGRWLGFFAEDKLKTVNIGGGSPQIVGPAMLAWGGSWNRDGVIIFAQRTNRIYQVSATGGTPQPVTVLDRARGETAHRWPSFLPDGKHFLYTVFGLGKIEVAVGSLDPAEKPKLVGQTGAGYVQYASGYLLFVVRHAAGWELLAQPFDAKTLRTTGDAAPIVSSVGSGGFGGGHPVFAVSENGVLAYQSGFAVDSMSLLWFDRNGKELGVATPPGAYFAPRLSPDGRKIAVEIYDLVKAESDLWIFDVAHGAKTRFTFGPRLNRMAVWSPDGRQIVFQSNRDGGPHLYQKPADGVAKEQLILGAELSQTAQLWAPAAYSWSPDGRYIAFRRDNDQGNLEAWMLPTFGDRKPVPFVEGNFDIEALSFSPDGKWVAYSSNESGRYEVYVTPFPVGNAKWQVSVEGGQWPQWRRDAKEIYYLNPVDRLMAANINVTGSSPVIGTAQPLFPIHWFNSLNWPYDVSADGQRFLVSSAGEQANNQPVTLVVNWDAELKKK